MQISTTLETATSILCLVLTLFSAPMFLKYFLTLGKVELHAFYIHGSQTFYIFHQKYTYTYISALLSLYF